MQQLQDLTGRNILVTGVSRPGGIGAAIVRRLAEYGARVLFHGSADYDRAMGYADASRTFGTDFAETLRKEGMNVTALAPSDLYRPGAGEELIDLAAGEAGYLDGLVLNHAYSTGSSLGQWTEEDIDRHLRVNVLASMMMIQAFAGQKPEGLRGAVTLFTSGQDLGPMTGEIPYAVSKAAEANLCRQAAAALACQNIQVNCVNPGPTDTGYLSGEAHAQVAQAFPLGKWGMPKDAARLVHFLQSEEARWITGQVISSEGGFQRG